MTILKQRITNISLLTVACMITYLGAVNAGFFSLDDAAIFNALQSAEFSLRSLFLSGGDLYFRPFVLLSFLFDLFLFGRNPAGVHMVNIFLHLMNGLLIYYLTVELMHADEKKDRYAFFASLFFMLHPLNTEAVVWIAARSDLICTLFFLLALILMIKMGGTGDPFVLAGIFVMFLFSLFGKEASIGLLAAAPAYYYLLMKKGKISHREAVLVNASVFAAAVIYLVLRSGQIGVPDAGITRVVSQSGAIMPVIIDSLTAYGYYISKLLYPFPLNFAILQINKVLSLTVLLLFVPLALLFFLHDERLRLPLLIVATGIVPPILAFIGKLPWSPYAERYLYLPMAGFSIVAAVVIITYARRIPYILLVSMLLLMAIPTVKRVGLWSDPTAFWGDVVKKSPDFHRAHVGLAVELFREGRHDDALEHLQAAAGMGLNTDFLWKNFAAVYYARRDCVNYERMMTKSAEISSRPTPIYIELIQRIMSTCRNNESRIKTYSKASKYYLQAFERDAEYTEGLYNAGKLYWVLGDKKNSSHYLMRFVSHEKDSMYKPFARIILQKINSTPAERL